MIRNGPDINEIRSVRRQYSSMLQVTNMFNMSQILTSTNRAGHFVNHRKLLDKARHTDSFVIKKQMILMGIRNISLL